MEEVSRNGSDYDGDFLSAPFVRNHFNDKEQKVAENLAVESKNSFEDSVHVQDWMDEETRPGVKKKLNIIKWKFGYTIIFDTHLRLRISKTGFGSNVLASV